MVTNNAIGTEKPIKVPDGGTGIDTATAYAVLCAGTTATGNLQNVSGVGTANQVLTSNGAAALPTWQANAATSGFTSVVIQTFTASGTYTPTSGMGYCIVEVVGAGGGGGGIPSSASYTSSSGGGGGGEYARGVFSAATIGASKTVTIGAAGTAGASGANVGGTGGTTSLVTLITAVGGSGGSAGITNGTWVTGGVGGTGGTGGDFRTHGTPGGSGDNYTDQGAGHYGIGGCGGSSFFGGGARSIAAAAGNTGLSYGGGGSGTAKTNGALAGGAGYAGIVVITEYI